MLNFREYKNNPDRLSDLLNWAALVAPDVVLNKDGSFQTTIRYRGYDLDSATDAELVTISARLNNVLKRLGSGWALYVEAERCRVFDYPLSHFDDPVSFLIDEERREMFEAKNYFESNYYLTLVYYPPQESYQKITSFFFDNVNNKTLNYEKLLYVYLTEINRFVKLLEQLFPEVEVLQNEGLLSFLHGLVTERKHKIALPKVPMYLDSLLCDTPLVGGLEPRLGEHYIKVISILGFPAQSYPGIFDQLNHLGIEYRWTTRFLFLDKIDAEGELTKYKRQWFSKRKGIATLIKETLTHSESMMLDSAAVNKANDVDEALQELHVDAVGYGYFTATITLFGKDKNAVGDEALAVEKVINGLGFSTKIETVNAVDAFLGSIHGNCRNNVRRPILNTLNLAHLVPISAVWAGQKRDEALNDNPLFYALTNGNTPFRFVPHVGDVGHTLVIGPTGAGKSVLLNFMEVQFLKYENAQVYVFDKGGSSRALTLALKGDYFHVGDSETDLTFQPLADIDVEQEKSWAHEWICSILQQENVVITPKVKNSLWTALCSLATAKKEERTLYGLTILLQDDSLRKALHSYTIDGAHGKLLDSAEDNLNYGKFQTFEMETLMETPSIISPVLSCIFHKLEKRFTGNPTLLVLDEAWLFLDNEMFRAKIREWLKVLRKANVMVVFATQSLSDVDQSAIATTIKEACFTKIYLPNSSAMTQDISKIYERFGLNSKQIELIAYATPKRDYYYTSNIGNRLFELGLGELALSYCAGSSKKRHRILNDLLKKPTDLFEFNAKFLKMIGQAHLAEKFQGVITRKCAA